MSDSGIVKKLELNSKGYTYDDIENHGLICTVATMKSAKHLIKLQIIRNVRGPSVYLDQTGARELLRWLTEVVEKEKW